MEEYEPPGAWPEPEGRATETGQSACDALETCAYPETDCYETTGASRKNEPLGEGGFSSEQE